MSDERNWKPWAVGVAVLTGVVVWFWWQGANPTLANGDYWCEGYTVATDGSRSLINARAEVREGKITTGPTGLDIAAGRQVTSWGDVEVSSRSEFLVRIQPASELAALIADPFWITCRLS